MSPTYIKYKCILNFLNYIICSSLRENKIQRYKELWEELKSYGTPFSRKLLFII